jgi:hypothetical protein
MESTRDHSEAMLLQSTVERGEAMLLECIEQEQLLHVKSRLSPEVIHDSEMLEQSLSELRCALRAEKLEEELNCAIQAKDHLREENCSLNERLTALAIRLRQVDNEASPHHRRRTLFAFVVFMFLSGARLNLGIHLTSSSLAVQIELENLELRSCSKPTPTDEDKDSTVSTNEYADVEERSEGKCLMAPQVRPMLQQRSALLRQI